MSKKKQIPIEFMHSDGVPLPNPDDMTDDGKIKWRAQKDLGIQVEDMPHSDPLPTNKRKINLLFDLLDDFFSLVPGKFWESRPPRIPEDQLAAGTFTADQWEHEELGTYTGDIKNNQFEGNGKWQADDSNWYEGAWSKSQFNGKGRFFYTVYNNAEMEKMTSCIYDGQFLDNLKHGPGRETCVDVEEIEEPSELLKAHEEQKGDEFIFFKGDYQRGRLWSGVLQARNRGKELTDFFENGDSIGKTLVREFAENADFLYLWEGLTLKKLIKKERDGSYNISNYKKGLVIEGRQTLQYHGGERVLNNFKNGELHENQYHYDPEGISTVWKYENKRKQGSQLFNLKDEKFYQVWYENDSPLTDDIMKNTDISRKEFYNVWDEGMKYWEKLDEKLFDHDF